MKENEVKIGAASNLNKKTAAENGAKFIENMIASNGWDQSLTKAQKKAAKKMAKELLEARRIDQATFEAILAQLDA
ncbi:MAG: hypothetical protein MR368_07620 [Azospirillum sp.]|nr:hypothetical protein [Azospirillum sp.]